MFYHIEDLPRKCKQRNTLLKKMELFCFKYLITRAAIINQGHQRQNTYTPKEFKCKLLLQKDTASCNVIRFLPIIALED